MGIEQPLNLMRNMTVEQLQDVYIIASGEQLAGLDDVVEGDLSALMRIALEPSDDLPIERLYQARALILEIDPSVPHTLTRLATLRRDLPGLPIAAAIRDTQIGTIRMLMRHGIVDVLQLPFDAVELAERIADLLVMGGQPSDKGAQLCPLICLVGATGGVGSTTVLTHLAAAVAEHYGDPSRVCLVDLALQSGDVANYVGLETGGTVLDLLEAGDRVDAEVVHSAVADSGKGFSVLSAPKEIVPIEEIDPAKLLQLLGILRQNFSIVLVDLPPSWLGWTLSTAVSASRILLVTEQRVASLRKAKQVIELLSSLDIHPDRVEIVVNRMEKRLFQAIATNDIEDTLNRRIAATLASDGELVAAQTQGLLINESARRSRFYKDIAGLAETLVQGDGA